MRTEERQQIDITFITIGLIRMPEDIDSIFDYERQRQRVVQALSFN